MIRLRQGLLEYARDVRALPGAASDQRREALAWQMVASLRRLDYTRLQLQRPIDPARADPSSDLFDAERAAILHLRNGDVDEAMWLVFLSIHFGKHGRHGWRRLKDVYSGLGGRRWTWAEYSRDAEGFRRWIAGNHQLIGGAFGNHRKYISIRADAEKGTPAIFESYRDWVQVDGTHANLIARLVREGGNDPHSIFDKFYQDMDVLQFGRLGKFDFLALLGRLGIAPISPGSTYLKDATGPRAGARLLFGGSKDARLRADQLEQWLTELDQQLGIGMQAMEDSICNWQKSPERFQHFRG